MDLGLTGKTALVTGAGGGLGGAVAQGLAREGVGVAVADVDLAAAESTVARIAAAGGKAIAVEWDLAELSAIDKNMSRIESELGGVDILVAITGGPPPTPATGQTAEVWERFFHSMVTPVIAIADRVLPGMRSRQWGRVITSTSSGIVSPIPNLGLSNSLRLSLAGWSKTLAREIGRDGVTTNIVVPGRIATGRITLLDQKKAERESRLVADVRTESVSTIPVGRYGDPAEYADVITFLASARASYLTGSIIRVDGGLISAI